MLSAVAARKARLQSKEQFPAASTPTTTKQPSPEPIQKAVQHAKPSSKRRPPSQAAIAQSKRRKVSRVSEKEKVARYFQGKDEFREQEDVIVVQDDDEDEAESSQSSEVANDILIAAPSGTRRAWTPSAPLQDSSDDEEDLIADQGVLELVNLRRIESAAHTPGTPPVLSTYRPIHNQNFFDIAEADLHNLGIASPSSGKVLCLSLTDRVALIGTYTFTILYGAITISGVTLTPSTAAYRVFAPRSSPLPVIECVQLREKSLVCSAELKGRFQEYAKSADALVLVQELKTEVEGLGRICRTFENVFEPSHWQKARCQIDLGLSTVHYVEYESKDCISHVTPPSWSDAVLSVLPSLNSEDVDFTRQVFLVKGAKKTGKSTFARSLLSNLVTRYRKVAFLECDLGQSEFTPGGMVALNMVSSPLFGPPFTHPSLPYRAHYIGSTSPRDAPSYYLEAIKALIQTYNLDIQYALVDHHSTDDPRITDVIPLVVNMMGWTKGLGGDLCRKIEEALEPSAIFEFEAPATEEGWNFYRLASMSDPTSRTYGAVNVDHAGLKTFTLEPVIASLTASRFFPADHRVLSTLSYFHAVFTPTSSSPTSLQSHYATSWNVALPLCAHLPLEVAPETALDNVILIGSGSEDIVPAEVDRVLNGAVVALVSCEPDAIDNPADSSDASARPLGVPYIQGVPPPPPSMSNCHGLALIRSVVSNASAARLHVLTPLPPSVLVSVNPRVLVKGEMELPVWGMLDFRSEDIIAGIERSKAPFLMWGKGAGMGGEKRRVRRNLMRRGQM